MMGGRGLAAMEEFRNKLGSGLENSIVIGTGVWVSYEVIVL